MNNIYNQTNNVNLTESVLNSSKNAIDTAKLYAAKTKAQKEMDDSIKSADQKESRKDSYEKSPEMKTTDTGIYSRESILEELRASEEQRVEAFKEMIRSMVAQQGQTVNLTFRGLDLHVTEEQRAAAEASISEGGEYSVDSVAGRIMDMAKALAGNDSSKLATLREAVQKGFSGAASILGRKEDDMPQITKDTYNEVMSRFDEWEKSFKVAETDAGNNTGNSKNSTR